MQTRLLTYIKIFVALGWQQCCGEPEWYPACAQQQGPVQGAPPRLLFVRLRPVEAVTSSDAVYSCTASPCHQSKIVQSLINIILTSRQRQYKYQQQLSFKNDVTTSFEKKTTRLQRPGLISSKITLVKSTRLWYSLTHSLILTILSHRNYNAFKSLWGDLGNIQKQSMIWIENLKWTRCETMMIRC